MERDGRTAIVQHALSYARKGMPVFPCDKEKRPLTRRGFYSASLDEEQIRAWFDAPDPPAIGIPTGETSGIWVLDVDMKNGKDGAASLDKLTAQHGSLPDTTTSLTPTGGSHYVWRWQRQIRCSTDKLGIGLDVRGDGGYIVAPPSITGDGEYHWEASSNGIAPAPDWLENLCTPPQRRDPRARTPPDDADRLRAFNALNAIKLGPDSSRDTWIEIGMAYKAAGGDFDRFDAWCQNQPGYDPDKVPKEWASFAVDGGIGPGTLFHYALEHGWRDGPELRFTQRETANPDEPMTLEEKLNKDGEPIGVVPSLANVVELIQKHERFAGRVLLNKLSGQIELMNGVRAYEADDPIAHEMRTWLDTVVKWTTKPARAHLFDALQVVASRQPYDPVHDYLTSLQWDGVERLPFWLSDVCGVERTEYTMAVASKVLIGAVARIFSPGCKLDTLLVLVGPQGALKSTLLRELATPWHVDTPVNLGNKDAYQALQGAWCYEFAELASFHGKEVERLKAFFSSSVDTYRPAYGRLVVNIPRRCWFAATTNDSEFLHDSTGARRFWAVEVLDIDLDLAKALRDQLWAEAVHAYHAGEPWHMEGEAAAEQAAASERHYTADPWEERIVAYLQGKDKTTASDVLEALGVEMAHRNKADAMRVTRVIRDRLGWRRGTVRIGSTTVKGYARVTGHTSDTP